MNFPTGSGFSSWPRSPIHGGARRGRRGAGHHPTARKSVSDSVAAALEGRVRLLVIDNCEHVLDAAADLVEAILAHSATVTILATSREGLAVADEQLWPVPSLDTDAGMTCRGDLVCGTRP